MTEVDVVTEMLIERPCRVVSDFAMDPDNVPRWYVNIKSVEWKTSRPVELGSQIAFVAQFLGKRLEYTYEIVELVPGESLIMRTAEGPFPMETSYRWEAVSENSTRMYLRNRGRPSGFSAVMSPFMSFMIRRANQKDLTRLKAVLEGEV
ncbi:SRPBCC family protein [bacterium]|jgi:uncharacterized membrane protein|nr:ATPase [Verrucomicrobiota bacterium]MDA7633479.1 SRPBCC family protein [bacterium]